MYIYKNEHNRQQADDWLWDTIPNRQVIDKSSNLNISHMIDLISSSPIVTSMKILFHQSHYCGHRFSDLASQIS